MQYDLDCRSRSATALLKLFRTVGCGSFIILKRIYEMFITFIPQKTAADFELKIRAKEMTQDADS
jgi:hypothetical protein